MAGEQRGDRGRRELKPGSFEARGMHAHFAFHDLAPRTASFREDVLHGLSRAQKALPPKYFYDDVGSALFEAICALQEYYPTRVETALLEHHAADIAARLGPDTALIEFGSGASRKSKVLIEAARPAVYVPIDISAAALRAAGDRLQQDFPELAIVAVCADYSRALPLPDLSAFEPQRRVIFFPGSTIGNFDTQESVRFLRNAAQLAGSGGALVIGVDVPKERGVLEAAYDDPQGVTAAFNLNLLARINRELGGDFDLRAFRHRAFYSEALGRIEMHLASCRPQQVRVGAETFAFAAGETIHTENSYKYSVPQFQALAAGAGFAPRASWVDAAGLFSLHYMTC
jgi:dimethylhistidine N-methyltransferase